jgi:L-threonylcarbamoyladenylate synthase
VSARLHINQAVSVLHAGGVIAYPTEAVFGLGCLPMASDAVFRILSIKARRAAKGLILIASEIAQIEPFVILPTAERRTEILASWPGPVTWVLPVRTFVPDWLTGGRSTLAVRVTAHRTAAELCARAASPLVSTSANRAGRPPLQTALAVRRRFGPMLDYLLAGAVDRAGQPTEIRDASSGAILRPA